MINRKNLDCRYSGDEGRQCHRVAQVWGFQSSGDFQFLYLSVDTYTDVTLCQREQLMQGLKARTN